MFPKKFVDKMAEVGDVQILYFVNALGELETFNGGSVFMNRLDSMDCNSVLGDYISTILAFRQLLGGLHYYNLILYFRDCPFNQKNVCSLLNEHSKKIKQVCGNKFISILHAFSFLDILITFCKYKALKEFHQERIEMCCKNLFRFVFKEDYQNNVSKQELENFLESPDMNTILNFIKSCYSAAGFFTTPMPTMGENKVYGENFKEPAEELRRKVLLYSLQPAPKCVKDNMFDLTNVLVLNTLPDLSEDLNTTEREDFENLLNRRVRK